MISKMLLSLLVAAVAALTIIQGVTEVSGATTTTGTEEQDSGLEKCCELGSSWAGQKLRCDKFTGPVSGVAPDEQQACLEAVEICCRKVFVESDCDQGKADARAGLECTTNTSSGSSSRRTPSGLGDFRRDCCEGCKLGLVTGSKRKGCSFKRLVLGEPWDSAFTDCCKETISTTPLMTTSTKTLSTTASKTTSESDELDYDDITDPTFNESSSVDLCKLMKGLLCSEICVPTPGSYICKCHEGSKLQPDGRTCISNTTTTTLTTTTTTIPKKTTSQKATKTTILTTPLKLKTTTRIQNKITKRSTSKTTPKKAFSTSKKSTSPKKTTTRLVPTSKKTKSRTTRSASSEDNELNLPCPAGYRYNPTSEACDDIDECAEEIHNCGLQRCYNLPGSFHCAKLPRPVLNKKTTARAFTKPGPGLNCIKGYKYNKTLDNCVDLNECLEVENACNSSSEDCINTVGSYRCTCLPGFRRDEENLTCIDINECQLENKCLSSQRCDNTIGSYTCVRFLPCGTGYTLNAATEICEDDDECALGTHDCIKGYHCRNTMGSYRCDRDKPGQKYPPRVYPTTTTSTWRPSFTTTVAAYTISRTTTSTTAKPNLTTKSVGNLGTAYNAISTTSGSIEGIPTVGSLITTVQTPIPKLPFPSRTICPRGYESGPQGQCIDVDECSRNVKMCGVQRCVNTIGSFSCVPRTGCSPGYASDPITGHCKDVDECTMGTHKCGPSQTCENRPGGYVCFCPPGFEIGANNECLDIDECTRVLSGRICGAAGNGKCINTPGSYRCVCGSGFENDPNTGTCRDVDECAVNPNQCQHECYNTWGGYRCGCQYGYRLRPDNRTCEDIDECTEFKDNNLCIGICDNTPGSYACRCPEGYTLGEDGRTCQDVDECVTRDVCKAPGETCQNLRGSHRCNKLNCPSGYVQDKQRKNRCVRENPFCAVKDTACFQRPAHYTYNYISIVSMYPIPSGIGHVELFTMRGAYNLPGSTVHFNLAFIRANAPPRVKTATEDYFALQRPLPSQAVLVMTKSIQGPQDIELEFSMEIYGPNGDFAGSAVARIFIIVTQYEF